MGPAHRSRFRSHAAVIVTLAALPILWTPNVVVARKVVGGFRVAIPGVLLFAADGWIATGYVFVCGRLRCSFRSARAFLPMAKRSPLRRWSAQSGGLVLGRHIDAGHGKRAVWYASATVAAIIVLRALATGSTPAAVVANTLGSLGGCLYIPTLMTAVYI
jgi:DHA1 family inner membrane transport protein